MSRTDHKFPLCWIAEKLAISEAKLESLLEGKVKGDPEERYIEGFDFFQWVFGYRPEPMTEEYRAFFIECNQILHQHMQGSFVPPFTKKPNEN